MHHNIITIRVLYAKINEHRWIIVDRTNQYQISIKFQRSNSVDKLLIGVGAHL